MLSVLRREDDKDSSHWRGMAAAAFMQESYEQSARTIRSARIMSEAGYPPLGQSVSKQRLYSCKLVSNRIYVNSDPAMPYQLPHEWRVKELADEIMRACADYDITANWEQAKFLAVKIAKELLKDYKPKKGRIAAIEDRIVFNGGFELGWD